MDERDDTAPTPSTRGRLQMTVSSYSFLFNSTRLLTVMRLYLTADSTSAGLNARKGAEIDQKNNLHARGTKDGGRRSYEVNGHQGESLQRLALGK